MLRPVCGHACFSVNLTKHSRCRAPTTSFSTAFILTHLSTERRSLPTHVYRTNFNCKKNIFSIFARSFCNSIETSLVSPAKMPEIMHFPSSIAIVAYLIQHPLTQVDDHPYLYEKGIIQTMANIFSEQKLYPEGVKLKISLVLYEFLIENLVVPKAALKAIQINLTQALIDCGNAKKLSLK